MSAVNATRRNLLISAVVATAVAPIPALASGHPDAALLAALGEFDALERQINGLYDGPSKIKDDYERDEAIDPLFEAQRVPLERLCSIQARTLEGVQARARTIVGENLDLDPAVDAMDGRTNDRLMGALLRDLLAMGSDVA